MEQKTVFTRKYVTQEVSKTLLPILKSNGFATGESNTNWRHISCRVDVVGIEIIPAAKARQWGGKGVALGISAGVFFDYIPSLFSPNVERDESRLLPSFAECHIRLTPFTRRPKRNVPNNIWQIESEDSIKNTCEEISSIVEDVVLPWFKRWDSIDKLLEFLDSEEEKDEKWGRTWGFGRKGSPVRDAILGFVALKAGRGSIAKHHLSQALSKGNLAALAGRPSILEDIRAAFARADIET